MSLSEKQKEVIDALPPFPHGILNLSPRIGKTYITLQLIKRDKPKKILWVTPNAELRDNAIPEEFKKWKMLTYLRKTDVVCWSSLSKVKGSYDTIILDELQCITVANSVNLIKKKLKYKNIIGLTGTLAKHLDKLQIMADLKLGVLESISIDEAVEQNLIADYNITVVECELDNTDKYITAGSATVKFKQTEAEQYSYMSKRINALMNMRRQVPVFMFLNRMRLIYNSKSKHIVAKQLADKLEGRTLIFTGGIQQAEQISEHYYHSKTDRTKLNMFLKGRINTLACVNSGGVGVTYRDVDNLIICQVDSNKSGGTIQKLARSLVLQEGYKANIYIIVASNTVDVTWKDKALEELNPDKITHISYKNYERDNS